MGFSGLPAVCFAYPPCVPVPERVIDIASKFFRTKRFRTAVQWAIGLPVAGAVGYYTWLIHNHPWHQWVSVIEHSSLTARIAGVYSLVVALFKAMGKSPLSDSVSQDKELARQASDLARMLLEVVGRDIERGRLTRPRPLAVNLKPLVWDDETQMLVEPADAEPWSRIAGSYRIPELTDLYLTQAADKLLVLGSVGSGKTATTLLLQRELLTRRLKQRRKRKSGRRRPRPIPVIMPLSTWDPKQPLAEWASSRLEQLNPALGFPGRSGRGAPTRARRLVDEGLVLLILDGLDEMKPGRLRQALEGIDSAPPANPPMIVACRKTDYVESLKADPETGKEGTDLYGAQIVELLAPRDAEIARYLRESSRPGSRKEWAALLECFDNAPQGRTAEALRDTLTVWLAGQVYGPKPRDAKEALKDQEAQQLKNKLLKEFIHKRFTEDPFAQGKDGGDGDGEIETKWLGFLARWLEARGRGHDGLPPSAVSRVASGAPLRVKPDRDLIWWRLAEHPEAEGFVRWSAGLFGGLGTGCAVGFGFWCVFSVRYSAPLAIAVAIAAGLLAGVALVGKYVRGAPPPTRGRIGRQPNRVKPLKAGVTVLAVALLAGYVIDGTTRGVWWGLVTAAGISAAYFFTTPFAEQTSIATPREVYRADIGHSVIYSVAYGGTLGTFAGAYHSWVVGLVMGLLAASIGGFSYGAMEIVLYRHDFVGLAAWLRFRLALWYLARAKLLPATLFAFLEKAYDLGVLRRSGTNYQFTHEELRISLAEDGEPAESGVGAEASGEPDGGKDTDGNEAAEGDEGAEGSDTATLEAPTDAVEPDLSALAALRLAALAVTVNLLLLLACAETFALSFIGVGLIVLLGVMVTIREYADWHRRHAGAFLGVTIASPYGKESEEARPRVAEVLLALKSPARWWDLIWLGAEIPVGFGLGLAAACTTSERRKGLLRLHARFVRMLLGKRGAESGLVRQALIPAQSEQSPQAVESLQSGS